MGRYKPQIEEPHEHGPDCNHENQQHWEIPENGKLILMFEQNDCEYCKQLETLIEAGPNPGIEIRRVNVSLHDMNAQLAQDAKIEKMPTLVFLKNQEEISRHEGTISPEQFLLFTKQ